MKPWWKSKVIIIGILQLLVAGLTYASGFFEVKPILTEPVTWILLHISKIVAESRIPIRITPESATKLTPKMTFGRPLHF